MTPRVAGRLAWTLWAAAVAVLAAALTLYAVGGLAAPRDVFGFPGFGAVVGLAQATVGALVASRRPSNPIGWLFLGLALVSGVEDVATAYAVLAFAQGAALPGAAYAAWVIDWTHVPFVAGTFVFVFLLFPHGRLPGRTGVVAALMGGIGMALALVGLAFKPGSLTRFPGVENPLPLIGSSEVALAMEDAGIVLYLLAGLFAVAGVLRRWRRATGVERQQYKWLVSAGALIALTFAIGVPGFALELLDDGLAWTVMQVLLMLGFTAIPVSVGFAVLRHRLYEIDRLVSRTVAYAVVVGLLAAVYASGVLLIGSLLPRQNEVTVAASTLAAAALFHPLRRRVQARVDRRFNRSRYDAARVIDRFRTRLRDQLDVDALDREVVHAVGQAMQPAGVSLWLRDTPSSVNHQRPATVPSP